MLTAADDQQRRFWDQHAETYDRSMRFFERRVLRDSRAWIGGRATGRVLEVGIGTGLNLPWYPQSVELVAVDLSPEMLARAQARAAELGLSIDAREGSAEQLPMPDASFDTVVCTLALCSIPDDRRAVSEMIRVLRPGGRLLLADHVESSWRPVRLAQRIAEAWTAPRFNEHFTRRPIRLLHAAGLRITEHERFLAGVIERINATKPAH